MRFNLEMITRDPLKIPCLTEKYWATLGKRARPRPGADAGAGAAAREEALPRITALPVAKQTEAEEENVRRSFDHARKELKSV